MMQRITVAIRVETGAVQINNDLPGVFIRGDDCLVLWDILANYDSSIDLTSNTFKDLLMSEIREAISPMIKTDKRNDDDG